MKLALSCWNKISHFFIRHPHSIGETYIQHLFFASLQGLKLLAAGLACIIHSIFPFLFINTASNTVQEIYQGIQRRKNKLNS